jgi:hypothetical protein
MQAQFVCMMNAKTFADTPAFVAAVENGYYADECLTVSVYPGGPGYDPADFIDKGVRMVIVWLLT